jgi:hypothetical protein
MFANDSGLDPPAQERLQIFVGRRRLDAGQPPVGEVPQPRARRTQVLRRNTTGPRRHQREPTKLTSPTSYRLTATQRERLAGFAELDPRDLRRRAGVSEDIVTAAVAGRELEPTILARLATFLERQPSA